MIATTRGKPAAPSAQVLHVTPQRFLESAAKRFVRGRPLACLKCGSTYIRHEPAFVHCRLCGKIARIADASLGDQEVYERQRGLRLAC